MPRIENLKAAVLDTHAWVWLEAGDPRGAALSSFHGLSYLPAISIWEVSMLAAKGRLHLMPNVRTWVENNLRHPIILEPLHPEAAILSSELTDFHGDRADRLVVAAAIVAGIPLISADKKIAEWARRFSKLEVICPLTGCMA